MLRKALQNDFSFIYELYMHPLINKYLLYEVMEECTFEPIFNDLIQRQVLFVFEYKGEKAGMVKLVPLTYRSAHVAYCGGVAIHPSLFGNGLGLLMMQEMIMYLQEKNFLRVELSVSNENPSAIHLYEKAGFKKIGLLKKYGYLQMEERYIDEWMMEYLM